MRAPKWRNKLDVYYKRNDSEIQRFLATLSLDKLGFKTNVQRACGRINEVCVMELPSRGLEVDASA